MLDKCRLQLLKKKQTDIHFRVHDLFLFEMEIVLDLTQGNCFILWHVKVMCGSEVPCHQIISV